MSPTSGGLLAEPLAVVLRGLRLAAPEKDTKVLILGAGTVGLLALAALRILGHRGEIHVVARHKVQAQMAQELGAAAVHASATEAAKIVGAKSYRPPMGPPASRGGFPFLIDAAGTESSLDQAPLERSRGRNDPPFGRTRRGETRPFAPVVPGDSNHRDLYL